MLKQIAQWPIFQVFMAFIVFCGIFKLTILDWKQTEPVNTIDSVGIVLPSVSHIEALPAPSYENLQELPHEEPAPPPEPVVASGTGSGCGDNQYANYIYMHESGCRLDAKNELGCLGIGQACPGSKLLAVCPDLNYSCQNSFFTSYASKYGGWSGAYQFWLGAHWW